MLVLRFFQFRRLVQVQEQLQLMMEVASTRELVSGLTISVESWSDLDQANRNDCNVIVVEQNASTILL